jgi:multidrug resistance protein, MATE family
VLALAKLVIALAGYWGDRRAIGVALGFAASLGPVGVWIGLASGLAAVAVLLMTRWLGKERQGFRPPEAGYGAKRAESADSGSKRSATKS